MRLRHYVGEAKRKGEATFWCSCCGYPAYVARTPRQQPIWKHFPGAPRSCPWYSGAPAAIDAVGAAQFGGRQEGPLHSWLKEQVGRLLEAHPATEPGSVKVDRYIVTEDERRRPDVRATVAGRDMAFEIQLATTTLPQILDRNAFYRTQGMNLIWVTWNFQGHKPGWVFKTAFEDILFAHGGTLFSLDTDLLEKSRVEKSLHLRAFLLDGGIWTCREVELQALDWLSTGLATVFRHDQRWAYQFLGDWMPLALSIKEDPAIRAEFLGKLVDRVALQGLSVEVADRASIAELLLTCWSILEGHPIGSRHPNLVGVINSHLISHNGRTHAAIVRAALNATPHGSELLRNPTVVRKLSVCADVSQKGRVDMEGVIACQVFPSLQLADRPMAADLRSVKSA
jgi:hypothetical protein